MIKLNFIGKLLIVLASYALFTANLSAHSNKDECEGKKWVFSKKGVKFLENMVVKQEPETFL